jgi:hypothetical protein
MNNILIKNHMPPVNIQMENRKEYYETLRIFQHSGDIKPTIDIILREYKRMEKELRRTGKITKKKKKAVKTKAKKTKRTARKKL